MKSKDISLGLLIFVAGTCFSCDSTDIKRCVDKNDLVVEDDKCAGVPASGWSPGLPYHWYYGGNGFMGQKASGGYPHPASGVSYGTHGSSKGGFGGSAGLHGAGGHGGGGVAA